MLKYRKFDKLISDFKIFYKKTITKDDLEYFGINKGYLERPEDIIKMQNEEEKKERRELRDAEVGNSMIVETAKRYHQENRWDSAIMMYNKSIDICWKHGWNDGVNWARVQISDCQVKLDNQTHV